MTLILLGAHGLIGSALLESFHSTSDFYSYSRTSGLLLHSNNQSVSIDKHLSLEDALNLISPTVIVNCVGSSKTPADMKSANIDFIYSLSLFLSTWSYPLTLYHISSMGVSGPYNDFNPSTLNLYETSKLCSEYFLSLASEVNPLLTFYLFRPSIVISNQSHFLRKLFYLFLLSPWSISSPSYSIPIIRLNTLSSFIFDVVSNGFPKDTLPFLTHQNAKLYTLNLSSCITLQEVHLSLRKQSFLYRILSIFKLPSCFLPSFLRSVFPAKLYRISKNSLLENSFLLPIDNFWDQI